MTTDIIGNLTNRTDRPAYVSFHKMAVEDKRASLASGHFSAVDVDFVHITPPYSKDVMKFKVTSWFENMKHDVTTGRMPQEWMDQYAKQYELWQKGQSMPLKGTPIRGWGVISPAQQETFIALNILTVEDLARITDEGLRRIGMGAVDAKNKACAWMAQMGDKGPLTMENADLKNQVRELEAQAANMEKMINGLQEALKASQVVHQPPPVQIQASEILQE